MRDVLRTHGSNPHYGNAAFWAGLGGWKGQPLEQGGVEDQAAAWSDRGHTYDVFVFDETTGMYNSRDYSIPVGA